MTIHRILVFWGLTSLALTFWALAWMYVTATMLKRQRMRYAGEVLEHMMALPVPEGGTLEPAPDMRTIEIVMDQQEIRYDNAAGVAWVNSARQAAIQISNRQGSVTADDIMRECPPPADVSPRRVASVFADRNLWEQIDWKPSERSHRKIAVWRTKAQAQGVAA
jgi:hypothetical protein